MIGGACTCNESVLEPSGSALPSLIRACVCELMITHFMSSLHVDAPNVLFKESLAQRTTVQFNFAGYIFDEHDRDSASLRLQFARYPGPRSGGGPRGRR